MGIINLWYNCFYHSNIPSIQCSTGSVPVGVQCSLISFTMSLQTALVPWAFAGVGVHRLSLRLSYLGVFPFTLFTCHWISFVFLLYDQCICTHRSTLHLLTFSVSFQAWDWFFTRCCGPMQRRSGVRMKQKSRIKFLPWPGFGPRTLQSDGRERYHSTTAHI